MSLQALMQSMFPQELAVLQEDLVQPVFPRDAQRRASTLLLQRRGKPI